MSAPIPKYFFWSFALKLSGLLVVAVVAFGLSISCGSEFIPPGAWAEAENAIIIKLRLLRSVNCFCIGGALAMAGAACQAVLRNPLAEPYILGVSGGAGVGAALAFLTGAAALSIYSIALFSFAGAFLALLLAIALGGIFVGSGGIRSDNILLSGVVIGALASSMLMFVISTLNFNELG
ncbi:MAG: iron chelate uptake ABC transporter family permease subunit, partial [Victivallaceae bacterium]